MMPQRHLTTSADHPASDTDHFEHCEAIARRGRPHLYCAAQLFGPEVLRRAFVATYASMRVIDDTVDAIPDRALLDNHERERYAAGIVSWRQAVRRCHAGDPPSGAIWQALAVTFSAVPLSIEPWEEMARAMSTDLSTPGFEDWTSLRDYMTGATIAPAVVFTSLVLARPDTGDARPRWSYERTLGAIADLGVFCYLVHILRDVAIDLDLGERGLIYFPLEDLGRFDLTMEEFRGFRAAGAVDARFEQLAQFTAQRARTHLDRGIAQLLGIDRDSAAGNRAALHYLVQVYVRLLAKLEGNGFDVFSRPIELTNDERREVLREVSVEHPLPAEARGRWETALPEE